MRKFRAIIEGIGHDLAKAAQKANLQKRIADAERSEKSASAGAKQTVRANVDSMRNQLDRMQEDAIEDTPSMNAQGTYDKEKKERERDKKFDDNIADPQKPMGQQKGKEPFQFTEGFTPRDVRGFSG